jgi:RNA polymerase sigma-70 factor, ECF subfamily
MAEAQTSKKLATQRFESARVLSSLPFQGDDNKLVEALCNGHPGAAAHLHARFAPQMSRVLFRLLGPDSELEDAVHDTFVQALESIHRLRDPESLGPWLTGVAVFTAKRQMQARARRRWLLFRPPEEIPERATVDPAPEAIDALRSIYSILRKLPPDERIAVTLRFVEGMTLPEAAAASRLSLSTFKRRLARGEKKFRAMAAHEPALEDWLAEGTTARESNHGA